jgi:hypothetical protein
MTSQQTDFSPAEWLATKEAAELTVYKESSDAASVPSGNR